MSAMNDLNLATMATSLQVISERLGTLTFIEDEISNLSGAIMDLNNSLDCLSDKVGELKNE